MSFSEFALAGTIIFVRVVVIIAVIISLVALFDKVSLILRQVTWIEKKLNKVPEGPQDYSGTSITMERQENSDLESQPPSSSFIGKNRPTWDEYFISLARVVATRSHDTQTQHGCVITKDNRILGEGYNGFPRGMRDEELPSERPGKYVWMIHSERNALENIQVKKKRMTAYVTGEPCFTCTRDLWNAGVTKIIHLDGHGTHLMSEEDRENVKILIEHTGLEIVKLN